MAVARLLTPLLALLIGIGIGIEMTWTIARGITLHEKMAAKKEFSIMPRGEQDVDKWEVEQLPIMKSISRGFHPIYVYSEAIPEIHAEYAQVKQDVLILALMKANNEKNKDNATGPLLNRRPFFVDLASNDALNISNSYLLELNGWVGLCLEPNPQYWYRLASFRNCTIVGGFLGGVKEEDGKEIDVMMSNGAFGGIMGKGMDNPKSGREGGEKRNIVSIVTVFKETNVPRVIDYFSLDVEGAESLVMEHFPWSSYSFKFMTIERPKDDLKQTLYSQGYKMARGLSSWGETLWIHNTSVHLTDEEIEECYASVGIGK